MYAPGTLTNKNLKNETETADWKRQSTKSNFKIRREIDVDDLMAIHYDNLVGEIITFPVVVNRLGLLLADAERSLAETKLNCAIVEAKLREEIRILLNTEEDRPQAPYD